MPTVYVTCRDPHTDAITTAAVESRGLSLHVLRATILAEGLELPSGDAVLPACLRGVSLNPPVVRRQLEPTAAKRKREPAAAER